MSFDIEKVSNEMISAARAVLFAESPKIQSCIQAAFKEEQNVLETIANARLKGDIDDEELKSQLEDEKDVLKAALLACKVKEKAAAQKAVNAAIKVLSDAIKVAIPAL